MKMNRAWAMPSANTFSIGPIAKLLSELQLGVCVVDPFARDSQYAKVWSNDLNPSSTARYHLHAEAFADLLIAQQVRATAVLFDPPYSYRQCREVYDSVGAAWLKDDQQQVGRWSRLKNKLHCVVEQDALVVSFGWNSSGFGKTRGYTLLEMLVVNHGSAHNDTIVTVERRR